MSQMMEVTVETDLCFPHLPNSSCRKPQMGKDEALLFYVVLPLISLVTTILNLLVIISIAHFRQLHSPTNLILLCLAVTDFSIGLVVLPAEVLLWKSCWMLGDLLCVLFFILPITFVMASVESMVLISVDRYIAICNPMHYRTRVTVKAVSITISALWVYAVGFAFLILHENFNNLGKYRPCYGMCVVKISVEADVILGFFIPISVIVVLYMRVFVVAVSQVRAMRSQVTSVTLEVSLNSRKSELKAARNLGVLVIVYLLCYCPYYFTSLAAGEALAGLPVEVILFFLVYVNSCINPFIYALLYPWFRKAIKIILTLQIIKPGSCNLRVI